LLILVSQFQVILGFSSVFFNLIGFTHFVSLSNLWLIITHLAISVNQCP